MVTKIRTAPKSNLGVINTIKSFAYDAGSGAPNITPARPSKSLARTVSVTKAGVARPRF